MQGAYVKDLSFIAHVSSLKGCGHFNRLSPQEKSGHSIDYLSAQA